MSLTLKLKKLDTGQKKSQTGSTLKKCEPVGAQSDENLSQQKASVLKKNVKNSLLFGPGSVICSNQRPINFPPEDAPPKERNIL